VGVHWYLNAVTASGFNFVRFSWGRCCCGFFIRVMRGVTMAFFEDVVARLRNLFATPLSIAEYLGLALEHCHRFWWRGVMLALATGFGLSFIYGLMPSRSCSSLSIQDALISLAQICSCGRRRSGSSAHSASFARASSPPRPPAG
jgi:hypothetical protein